MELSVPIPNDSSKTSFTVEDCLQKFVNPCFLDKDINYKCKMCGTKAV